MELQIFEMTQKKRDRCLQEVTLLQQLNHPFIIQMLDAFIDENMLIIIFEWAPAGAQEGVQGRGQRPKPACLT
jgi:NIMA (never in mitosis gene a)-related kinase